MQVGIIGAAGLSGLELIRILRHHPAVELGVLTSDRYAAQPVGQVFPQLGPLDACFAPNAAALGDCALVFLAVPNAASLERVPQLLAEGRRVIDLSGVFRLQDPALFTRYYGLAHTAEDCLRDAVFGLPEAYRARIKGAQLIANPGCYPTGALLGLLPLAECIAQLAQPPIIDAKSGVSGAGGRVEDDSTAFMTVQDNCKPYKLFTHQHTPEIEQVLVDCLPYPLARCGGVVFTPHLLPCARGILSTIHLRFTAPQSAAALRAHYAAFAAREDFVTLLPAGAASDLHMVQGRNQCVISLHHSDDARQWIVCTAIDNLLKGAAGQAVQNMNIACGFPETQALDG